MEIWAVEQSYLLSNCVNEELRRGMRVMDREGVPCCTGDEDPRPGGDCAGLADLIFEGGAAADEATRHCEKGVLI